MKDADELKPPNLEGHEADLSFLLRVWKEGSGDAAPRARWRYSLKDIKTKAQRGFADLDSLVIYFRGLERESSRERNCKKNSQNES